MELRGKKLNVLGDSITEGCGADSAEYRFTDVMARKGGFAAVRNYGIGGTRIAPQHSCSADPAWDQDFCGRYAAMADDADIVLVFGGTNDFGHGDAPLGTLQDTTADSFCGACRVLFRGLRRKYPAAAIVVVTPLHRAAENNPRGDGSKQPGAVLSEYVAVLRTLAAEYHFPLAELYDWKQNPAAARLQPAFFPDGLHPSNAGHAILAELLLARLRELPETASAQ